MLGSKRDRCRPLLSITLGCVVSTLAPTQSAAASPRIRVNRWDVTTAAAHCPSQQFVQHSFDEGRQPSPTLAEVRLSAMVEQHEDHWLLRYLQNGRAAGSLSFAPGDCLEAVRQMVEQVLCETDPECLKTQAPAPAESSSSESAEPEVGAAGPRLRRNVVWGIVALLDVASTPSGVAPGVLASLGATIGPVVMRLRGGHIADMTVDNGELRAKADLSMMQTAVGFTLLGYRPEPYQIGGLRLTALAEMERGRMHGTSYGVSYPASATAPWRSLNATAELAVQLPERVHLHFDLTMGFTLVRPRVMVRAACDTAAPAPDCGPDGLAALTLHETSPLFARASVGFAYSAPF